ncbi:MAG TPA: adenylate/guanylate cyclase domain-containing protein [Casimicrobiaceae bacterium]|nr:adenylate/guanylate cyclase domain-containing protein [Casimicrobiaceae bacterium]
MTRDQRRLAAIVSVDVVGYSRLMGRDEPGTLAGLKALRQKVIDPKIAEYGGRIVNTAGDNQLLEFPSVVDAVRCSVDVQRGVAEINANAAAEHRIEFRIGINVGDIIVSGDQIFGDGVNVAARVQALAPPGGICASKVVRDQVLDKLSFSFEDLGAHEVKNIARPVEVCRVDFGGTSAQMTSEQRCPRLAVAVLPFTAPGGRADDAQLAEAFTRDLTAALGTIRLTQVVSRDLAASYNGKPIDPRRVGRELDASYLVEGEVRRVDRRIEVDAQLIEAASATQLWSERLHSAQAGGPEDVAGLLSRLASRIRNAIHTANKRRFASAPPPGAGPVELTLHGYSVLSADPNSMAGVLESRKWFDQALRFDPNFLRAVTGRWNTLKAELELDPGVDFSRVLGEMDELSSRAVSIDSADSISWSNRAATLIRKQRWEAALEALAKAEKLSSVSVGWALNQRAQVMIFTGQPDEALALVDRQLALDTTDQEEVGWAMLQRGRAYMALGRYDEAIAACERHVALDDWWLPHLYLAAGYALKGEPARAAAEKATLLEFRPGTSIADFRKLYWSDNPAFVQQTETHLLAGLRKAGFPER